MASNARNRTPPAPRPEEAVEQQATERRKGLWLGRWVMSLAIIAFLVVYVVQISRGSNLLYTVLFAAAAMGVAGAVGLAIRQMLLHTAASGRAEAIVQQVEERSREREEREST